MPTLLGTCTTFSIKMPTLLERSACKWFRRRYHTDTSGLSIAVLYSDCWYRYVWLIQYYIHSQIPRYSLIRYSGILTCIYTQIPRCRSIGDYSNSVYSISQIPRYRGLAHSKENSNFYNDWRWENLRERWKKIGEKIGEKIGRKVKTI